MNLNSETEERSDKVRTNGLTYSVLTVKSLVGNVILRNDFVNMYLNYIASQLAN